MVTQQRCTSSSCSLSSAGLRCPVRRGGLAVPSSTAAGRSSVCRQGGTCRRLVGSRAPAAAQYRPRVPASRGRGAVNAGIDEESETMLLASAA